MTDVDQLNEPTEEHGQMGGLATIRPELEFVAAVARQVESLHQTGRFHGQIGLRSVGNVPSGEVELTPPLDFVSFDQRSSNEIEFPPELNEVVPINLPTALIESRRLLADRRVSIDPIAIDVYQLGALLCQKLTGQSLESYLSSPRTVSQVPTAARHLIDGAIGIDFDSHFATAGEFALAVSQVADGLEGCPSENHSEGASGIAAGGPPASPSPGTRPTKRLSDEPEGGHRDDLPFRRLGHFDIVRRIGHGGMGDVYLGYEADLDRHVAIKVLPREFAREPDFVRRFRNEAAAAARLTHPNVVQVFFAGQDDGHLFFAMQFVSGESLAHRLAAVQNLNATETLDIVGDVLNGLAAAHRQGLIHRDVKPANVFLESTGRAILGDFGLVKSQAELGGGTSTGIIMGTVDYIAPEQGRGWKVDGRSDLYSIGVMTYQMLSGRLPFEADSPTAMIFQHVYEQPPDLRKIAPDVPPGLQSVVAKLMEKAPADRYQSAEAVLADIRAFQAGAPLPSATDPIQSQESMTGRPIPRRKNDVGASGQLRQATEIITAPAWAGNELTDLPVIQPPDVSRWRDWFDRILQQLSRHVPERVVEQIRSTEQQLDGAIAKYADRRDRLMSLIAQAEDCLSDLNQQASDWQRLLTTTESETTEDASAKARSLDEAQQARDALRELGQCQAEQERQLAEMRLQAEQFDTRLQGLVRQRDLMAARLATARAQARVAGGRLSRDVRPKLRRSTLVVCGTVVLCLLAFAATRMSGWFATSGEPAGIAIPTVELPSDSPSGWVIDDAQDVVVPLSSQAHSLSMHMTPGNQSNYEIAALLRTNMIARFMRIGAKGFVTRFPLGTIQDPTTMLAVSPKGTYMAVAVDDGSIRIFKSGTAHEEYRRLDGHATIINSLNFSDDESTLVSLGRDGKLRVWDISSSTEISSLSTGRFGATDVSLNDNQTLALIVHGNAELALWNLLEDRKVRSLGSKVKSAMLTPDAATAIARTGENITVWDAATGAKLREFGKDVRGAAFSRDTTRVLTSGWQGLQLWDWSSGELIHQLPIDVPENEYPPLLLSENGEVGVMARADKTLHIMQLPAVPPPPNLAHTFHSPTPIYAMDVSRDGEWVAGGADGKTFLWNLTHPTASTSMDTPNPISAVTFSPDGTMLAYGTGMDQAKTNYVAVRKLTGTHNERFFHRNNDWRKLQQPDDRVTALSWTADGERLVVGTAGGDLSVWAPEFDQVESSTHIPLPVTHIVANAEPGYALIGADSPEILRWNIHASEEPASFFDAASQVTDFAIAPKEGLLAVATLTGSTVLYDMPQKKRVGPLSGDFGRVTSLHFAPTLRQLAIGNSAGTIVVWDADSDQEIIRYADGRSPITAVRITPDARYVVAAALNGRVNVWKLP